MQKILKLLLAALWLISLPLFAQNENAGSTGFESLKLLFNARVNAMGGAVYGIPENPDALDYNPAAILNTPSKSVSSTFIDHLVGSGGGSIAYIYPHHRYIAWGAGLRYWNSGEMERTQISSTGELIETGENFGAHSIIASVSHARFISPAVDLGATAKFIFDTIDAKSASAALIDLGILHHTANERIKVGVNIRNIGLQTSYYTDSKVKEKLPFTYGAGLGIQMKDNILGAIDIGKCEGENIMLKLGLEYELTPAFILRGGVRSNAADYNMDGPLAYTSGLSLGLGWKIKDFGLDYAVASYGDLGITNQLTLRYNH
ncbi:MAG: PorV/PorQ family protein [Candidatus Cloacimonadaceae bacterium]